MINLLPSDAKIQLRASRTNLLLLKYIIVLLAGAVFLGAACLVVNMNLDNIKKTNENRLQIVTSRSSSSTSDQIELARNDLTNAIEIITQQISYNKALLELAKILPQGVIVDSLNVDNDTINAPIAVKLRAKSQDNVAKLNSGFQNSSVFSGYRLESSNTTSIDPDYPIDITINVTINKANIK